MEDLRQRIISKDQEEIVRSNEFWVKLDTEWGLDLIDLEDQDVKKDYDSDLNLRSDSCCVRRFKYITRSRSNVASAAAQSPYGVEEFRRSVRKRRELGWSHTGETPLSEASQYLTYGFLQRSLEDCYRSCSCESSARTDQARMSSSSLENIIETIDHMFDFVDKIPKEERVFNDVDRSVSYGGLSFDDSVTQSPTTSEDEGIGLEKLVEIGKHYCGSKTKARNAIPQAFRTVVSDESLFQYTDSDTCRSSPDMILAKAEEPSSFKDVQAFWKKLSENVHPPKPEGINVYTSSKTEPLEVISDSNREGTVQKISITITTTPNSSSGDDKEDVFTCNAYILDQSYEKFINEMTQSNAANTSTLNRSKENKLHNSRVRVCLFDGTEPNANDSSLDNEESPQCSWIEGESNRTPNITYFKMNDPKLSNLCCNVVNSQDMDGCFDQEMNSTFTINNKEYRTNPISTNNSNDSQVMREYFVPKMNSTFTKNNEEGSPAHLNSTFNMSEDTLYMSLDSTENLSRDVLMKSASTRFISCCSASSNEYVTDPTSQDFPDESSADATYIVLDQNSENDLTYDAGVFGQLFVYDNCTPPENDLQKNSDRVLSEHELRVQRSLQKLNVPDWYKNAPASREGFLLRKRLSDAASSPSSTRWPGLNGKTTSLGSLGGATLPPAPPQLSPANTSFGRWSTNRLNSNQTSPCSSTRSSVRGTVSPLCSPSTRSSFSSRTPYLGWRSQERLSGRPRTPHERLAISLLPQNSTASKASEEIQTSIKEVTSAIVHYVSALEPNNSDEYRTPSPRGGQKFCWVESSFVGTKPLESPQTPVVSGQASLPPAHPRPPSSLRLELHHRDRQATDGNASQHSLLNLGLTRPSPGSTTLEDVLDSLLGLPASSGRVPTPQASPRRSHNPYNSIGYRVSRYSELDSTADHVRSSEGEGDARRASETERSHRRKSSADSSSCSTLPPGMDTADSETQSALLNPTSKSQQHRPKSFQQNCSSRRQSEPVASRRSLSLDRRVSFDVNLTGISDMSASKTSLSDLRESKTSLKSITSINTDNSGEETLVRCRYSKCHSKATLTDAKRNYKSCHNCNYMYCSRECRRAHWEKHRKVCLHSRASTLCRQILSTAKEDQDSLYHVSNMGYKSYLSAGRGVVKVFFTSPESAEKFITGGFQNLGEPNYVRWQDLEPNEMGAELYAELVKLCKSYNPETKVILYVAVCIVSEVPTKGAVKWERQLVSRCAKMRLSKAISSQIDRNQTPALKYSKADSATGESTSESGTTEALILTSAAVSPSKRHMASAQKIREISFANIQKQLHLRGVSLRRHFPEVYAKLCAYVDGTSDRFAPVTVYPRDNLSGKSFMCVIMPDTEPDKFDMLPDDNGSYLKIDVSVDDASDQMSTPM